MKSNKEFITNSDSTNTYSTQKDWDGRYLSNRGLGVPGTFTHSDKGNRYFYRSKFKALDRCLKAINVHLCGKTVLDAAGGSGQFIDYFLKRGASHILVADFAQKALDIVNQHHKKEPRVSTLLFDLKDKNQHWGNRYDFVFAMEVIFLLKKNVDLAQAIKNLASALKVGGYLIISDVFPPQTIQENTYVVRRSKAHFECLLAQNELSVIRYIPQTFVFNRHIFGRFQHIVEKIAGPFLYWFDQIAIELSWRPPADSLADVRYLIAKKQK